MKIRAKYLWRADGSVLENAILETRGKKIVSARRIGAKPTGRGVRDLGDAIILPGFVNAHTHLELSSLRGRVRSGRDFARWLEKVRALRAGMTARDLRMSSRAGVEESLRSGTTTIVDHGYTGTSLRPLRAAGLRAHLVFEMIALHPNRISILEKTYRRMVRESRGSGLLRVGVAPHAPYTASAELYRSARKWIGPGQVLSTHLSEHPAEREFLISGEGLLRWLLLRRNMALHTWEAPRLSPVRYMESLGVLRRGTLLVHCNYLNGGDIRILEERRMPVVYCPRSHAFFQHTKHPVHRLRRAGVCVALGTDSLTSNRSLSILDEMKFLAGKRGDLAPQDLFEMGTRDGARAVMGNQQAGVVARGRLSDLTAVSVSRGRRRPLERALDDDSRVLITLVDGKVVFDASTE
ncbi:MAG: amidohydrolase family protein [Planctomycetota bacterium]|nr:amidohydrolase family protein [Planctomycetota bacterium]